VKGYPLGPSRAVLVVVVAALIGLPACGGGGTVISPTAPAAATASQAAPLVVTAGSLSVTILSPADETVVTVPQVDVVGQAPAEAVISVNDNMVVAGATGQFSTTVPLQEGPNEINVVASDVEGDEASNQLIITYDPPG